MKEIERYVYVESEGAIPVCDADGFWTGRLKNRGRIYQLSNLISVDGSLFGGIIVGEGDCGKSFFMRMFDHRIPSDCGRCFVVLRDYNDNDSGAIEAKVEACVKCGMEDAKCKRVYVLIDGLDERRNLMGLVRRLVRRYFKSDNVGIWIATRKLDGLEEFAKEFPELRFYKLAPFREVDVKTLAIGEGLNGDAFVKDARGARVADICSKPGGCLSCIRVYKRNGNAFEGGADLLQEVALDLCSEHRDGCPTSVEFSALRHTGEKLIEAAAWLATALVLQGKQSFHCGDLNGLPGECLMLRDWITKRYDSGVVAEVVQTRLFEPFGQFRMRFSVPRLPYYLAARWLVSNVSEVNLKALLIMKGGLLSREVENVIAWMEVLRPGFAAPLIKNFPELILGSAKSLKKQLPSAYYSKLEDRYLRMTDDERSVYLDRNLSALTGLGYDEIVHKRLKNVNLSEEGMSFAIEVATHAGIDIATDLINFVIDESRDLGARRKASYELPSVGQRVSKEQRRRLRVLLGKNPDSIQEETILGNVLSALWPIDISPLELVRELRKPIDSHCFSSYESFCRRALPVSFGKTLTQSSIKVFLQWAADFVSYDEPFDYLGELAREIFTCAWRFVKEEGVATLMALCVKSVCAKKHYAELPFTDKNDSRFSGVPLLDEKSYAEDFQGRKALLLALIDISSPDCDLLGHLHVMSHYPLIGGGDFQALVDHLRHDENHEDGLVQCLRNLAWLVDGGLCSNEFEWLTRTYPEINEFSLKYLAEQRQAYEKKSEGWRREREANEKKYEEERNERRDQTLKHLSKDDLKGGWFLRVSEILSADDWGMAAPLVRLIDSPGWKALDEKQRENLLRLAKRFLSVVKPVRDKSDATGIYVVAALVLLYEKDCLGIDEVPPAQWVVLLRHVFGCTYHLEKDDLIWKVVDYLLAQIPNEVDSAFCEAVKSFYRNDYSEPVSWWMPRLTRAQFDWILDFVKKEPVHGKRLRQLLATLQNFGEQTAIVEAVHDIVDPRFVKPLDDERLDLLSFAFSLTPHVYVDFLLRMMRNHSDWFAKWLGRAVYYRDFSEKDVLSCGPDFAHELCDWLICHYPIAGRPKRGIVFRPEDIDEIYFFRDRLISCLWQKGRKEYLDVLERLAQKFPREAGWGWILKQAKETIRKGLSDKAIISEEDLKALAADSECLLVNDSETLQRAVYAALKEFEVVLRTEFLPVRALWNEVPLRLWCQKKCDHSKQCARLVDERSPSIVFPRDESWLSDAVALYLNAVMKNQIVNREPQASPEAQSGSMKKAGFVDVKVECRLSNGEHCTVYVEVKCNFNPTVKRSIGPQLLDKYVKSRPGSAGILLCGCYSALNWIDCDSRKSRIPKDYRTLDAAQKSLEKQLRSVRGPIKVLAIDCGLH